MTQHLYEDYSINNITDDIFFDSKGDIAVSYINVDYDKRIKQLTKDIYHLIKVNDIALLEKDKEFEKDTLIKGLFKNDLRIKDFDIIFNEDVIEIENLEIY